MRCPLHLCAAVALTVSVGEPMAVRAHEVGDVVTLGFNGWLAPFGDSGTEEYTDVWAEGSHAYLGTVGSGVAVLDLDTGAFETGVLRNPELATVYAPTSHLDYQDIKIDAGIGYFSGGLGTDVVDLSVPTAPALISRIDPAVGGFGSAKNVAVGAGFLYQVDTNSSEVRVFNIAQPASPSLVRTIDTGDSVGLNDVTLVDDRLYVAGAGDGTYVYDVGNVAVSQPTLFRQVATGPATASVWPTADGETLLVTHREPGGELSAWDISPSASLVDSKSAGDLGFNGFSTSEVVVVGSRAYVAWNQGGIRIIDIDERDTLGLQLAGSRFIQGTTDFNGFNGVRSVYPFLGQDQVLISDSKRGLWRFDTTAVPVDLIGDYDANGFIGQSDYAEWNSQYGSSHLTADGNGDGVIDAADYAVWRDALITQSTASSLLIPEPCGGLLLLLIVTHSYALPLRRK